LLCTSDNHDEVPEDVRKFNMNTAGFFYFTHFKCDGDFCKNEFKVKSLPALLLFSTKPEVDILTNIEKAIKLPLEYDGIVSEVKNAFSENFKVANSENFHRIMKDAVTTKIPLLYFYDVGEAEIAIHLLSSDPAYNKYIEFIVMETPPIQLIQHFKIKSLPSLFFLIADKNDPERAQSLNYNEEIIYSRLKHFINLVILN
jgi:hypothetical protein